jgi:hypothetical protein
MKQGTPDPAGKIPFVIRALLPRHGVYFTAWQVNRQEVDRFCGLFQAVWRRLPLGVRRSILDLWRSQVEVYRWTKRPTGHPKATGWPPKYAAAHLIGGPWRTSRAMGTTSLGGLEMTFEARFINEWAPLVAQLMAHELAHVFQHAAGYRERMTTRQCEADAHRLQAEWGFFFGRAGHVSAGQAANALAAGNEIEPHRAEA